MNCEYCSKEIKGRKKRYCGFRCNRRHYYQKVLKFKEIRVFDSCKCGNQKQTQSIKCQKCHWSNKYKGQVSRSSFK